MKKPYGIEEWDGYPMPEVHKDRKPLTEEEEERIREQLKENLKSVKVIKRGDNEDYNNVQKRVNEILYPLKKTIDKIAAEVVRGEWGNGEERYRKLTEAGYNYDQVQRRVNQILYKYFFRLSIREGRQPIFYKGEM